MKREKEYSVYLDAKKIGVTLLEYGDPPMGVVFGELKFLASEWNYHRLKSYCKDHQIDLAFDYPEDQCLATRTIESLQVKNEKGLVIKGIGNQITAMPDKVYEISIEGVNYQFYREEFPHHVLAYEKRFLE